MTSTPATPTDVIDTGEMVVIHSFLRREFRLAGGVVRRVRSDDPARVAVVADHLDFLGRFLHHHHTIEDELLWPLLLERIPEELAPIVELMETQHHRVDAILVELARLLHRWRESPADADRDRLADLHDELYVLLVEHLDAEETRLLPIASRSLSQAEWDALGDEGRRRGNVREGPLVVGMFQYEGDPAVFGRIIGKAPLPVRVIFPRLARRAFRKHARRIHGTTTP